MATTERLRVAGGTTKRYLTGLGVGGWLKLGVVVLLFSIGTGIGTNLLGVLTPETPIESIDPQQVAGPAAFALIVVFAVSYVAAVADFVFVASLRSGRLPLRSYARANLRRAGWLLAFRAAVGLVALAVVAAAVAATVELGGSPATDQLSGVAAIAIGLAVTVAVVGWLVVGTLTNAFVVPIMQYEHRGPLSAWRRFTGAIAGRWRAVAVFLLVALLISMVVGIALFIFSFFLWFVGGLLLVGGGVIVADTAPALEPVVAAVLVAAYLGYRYVVALLRAPVRCYLRYYALLLLGDATPGLAMIDDELTDGTGETDDVGGTEIDDTGDEATADADGDGDTQAAETPDGIDADPEAKSASDNDPESKSVSNSDAVADETDQQAEDTETTDDTTDL